MKHPAAPDRQAGGDDVVEGAMVDQGLARLFRRDMLSGKREFVRDIRVQDPAGVTAFDIIVSRDGQAYAYTKSLRLANLFVVEG